MSLSVECTEYQYSYGTNINLKISKFDHATTEIVNYNFLIHVLHDQGALSDIFPFLSVTGLKYIFYFLILLKETS